MIRGVHHHLERSQSIFHHQPVIDKEYITIFRGDLSALKLQNKSLTNCSALITSNFTFGNLFNSRAFSIAFALTSIPSTLNPLLPIPLEMIPFPHPTSRIAASDGNCSVNVFVIISNRFMSAIRLYSMFYF